MRALWPLRIPWRRRPERGQLRRGRSRRSAPWASRPRVRYRAVLRGRSRATLRTLLAWRLVGRGRGRQDAVLALLAKLTSSQRLRRIASGRSGRSGRCWRSRRSRHSRRWSSGRLGPLVGNLRLGSCRRRPDERRLLGSYRRRLGERCRSLLNGRQALNCRCCLHRGWPNRRGRLNRCRRRVDCGVRGGWRRCYGLPGDRRPGSACGRSRHWSDR